MSTLTLTIVVVFIIGYLCIALETLTKVNKAAVALLMLVACWTLYMFDPGNFAGVAPDGIAAAAGSVIEGHLGSTATTLFFLMGAMTIVEVVDQNGGFNFVRDMMKTKSKKALLWRITVLTFFLSAILDNMTTAIVMVMILRKLIKDHKDRLIYASLIIIAANSGGAFSPIGDVTTIMLWNKSLITAGGVIKELFIPSIISVVIPAYILSLKLKGQIAGGANLTAATVANDFTDRQRTDKPVFEPYIDDTLQVFGPTILLAVGIHMVEGQAAVLVLTDNRECRTLDQVRNIQALSQALGKGCLPGTEVTVQKLVPAKKANLVELNMKALEAGRDYQG